VKEFSVGDVRLNIAEVLDSAANEPVRIITLRARDGERRPAVIMISESEYLKLKGSK